MYLAVPKTLVPSLFVDRQAVTELLAVAEAADGNTITSIVMIKGE